MKNQEAKQQSKKVVITKDKSKVTKPIKVRINSNKNTKNLKKDSVRASGFSDINFNQVIDTVGTVAKTAIDIIENPINPLSYKDVPASIIKTINTVEDVTNKINDVTLSGVLPNTTATTKMINKIKKEAPVFSTSNIPSSFMTEFKTPEFKITPNPSSRYAGMNSVRVVGTSFVDEIYFPGVDAGKIWVQNGAGGYRTADFSIGNFGGRFDNMVTNYDRRRINRLVYSYQPSCATTIPGNVHMFARWAPTDPAVAGSVEISDASQFEIYSTSSSYGSNTMVIEKGFSTKFNGDVSSSDPKFYADWFICIGNSGGSSTTYSGELGKLYVTYDIDLIGAVHTPIFPPLISSPWLCRFLCASIYDGKNIHLTNKDMRNFFLHIDKVLKTAITVLNKETDLESKFSQDCVLLLEHKVEKIRKKGYSTSHNHSVSINQSQTQLSALMKEAGNRIIQVIDKILKELDLELLVKEYVFNFLAEMLRNVTALRSGYKYFLDINALYDEIDDCLAIDFLFDEKVGFLKYLRVAMRFILSLYQLDKELEFDEAIYDNIVIEEEYIKL